MQGIASKFKAWERWALIPTPTMPLLPPINPLPPTNPPCRYHPLTQIPLLITTEYPHPLPPPCHITDQPTTQINLHHKPTPPPQTTDPNPLRHHYHTTHATATRKTTSYWRTHAYLCCYHHHHTGIWVWGEERAAVEQKQEREEKIKKWKREKRERKQNII